MLYVVNLFAQINIYKLDVHTEHAISVDQIIEHLHKKPLGLNKPFWLYVVNKVISVTANNSLANDAKRYKL